MSINVLVGRLWTFIQYIIHPFRWQIFLAHFKKKNYLVLIFFFLLISRVAFFQCKLRHFLIWILHLRVTDCNNNNKKKEYIFL